eukprot:9437433-Alexandrium_andersonii.AAC.1
MSASLVGSEMCIRDRTALNFPTTRWLDCSDHPDRPDHHDCPDRHGPVSYTHLTLPTICSV